MISAHSHIFALFLRGHHTQQSGPDTNFLLNNSLCQQKLVADRICQPVFSLAFYSRVELPSSKRVNRLNRFESCQGSLRNKRTSPVNRSQSRTEVWSCYERTEPNQRNGSSVLPGRAKAGGLRRATMHRRRVLPLCSGRPFRGTFGEENVTLEEERGVERGM